MEIQKHIIHLLNNVVPARFKAGQVIGSTAALMGIAFAMFRNVDKENVQNINQCSYQQH